MKRVLIAVNEPSFAESLQRAFEQLGYEVRQARDGETAYDLALQWKAGVIIADVHLKKMDGVELCWRLRAHTEIPTAIIVLLAEQEDGEIELNAYRSGADAFLRKSYSVRDVVVRVETLVDRFEQLTGKQVRLSCAIGGELSEFLVIELIQWLHQNQKTGRLWLSRLYHRGSIYFERGNIVHARLGDVEGEEAIYAMSRWREGRFEFEVGPQPLIPNVEKTTMEILLECGRRIDEQKILHPQNVGS